MQNKVMLDITLSETVVSIGTVPIEAASGKAVYSKAVLSSAATNKVVPEVIDSDSLETLPAFFKRAFHQQVKLPSVPTVLWQPYCTGWTSNCRSCFVHRGFS